jgi:hypothetical protein
VKEMPKAKTKPKTKAATKKKGQKSYETGVNLENRVAKWLSSQFGYNCAKRDLARGKISKRPYEVDIHGIKEELFGLSKTHLWVECKAYTVKRTHVTKLVESARDVKELNEEHDDIQKWSPSILMLASNHGFDVDAVGLADKYKIYCVNAGTTFGFAGKRNRADFENKESSKY